MQQKMILEEILNAEDGYEVKVARCADPNVTGWTIGFGIHTKPGHYTFRVLSSQRDRFRTFKSLDSVAKYLAEVFDRRYFEVIDVEQYW